MPTKLSDKLAELSVATRKAEDAAQEAQRHVAEKIHQMSDETHAAAQRRIADMDAKLATAKDDVDSAVGNLKSKIKTDITTMQASVRQHARKIDAKLKGHVADRLENEAADAVDYAIFSIECAQIAILDAIAARKAAIDADRI